MLETLNAMLALFRAPNYLEIGLGKGLSFHGVQTSRKTGVDPHPAFDVAAARRAHPDAVYHQTTSDTFFAAYSGPAFDVVYIDGLHTAEQTLRDLMNVTAFIHANSIIIIDDVEPNAYPSSLPSMADSQRLNNILGRVDPAWMGDVFRLVYFIETFMQQYSFASPIGGNPQLVLWRQARASTPERTLKQVGDLDFASFMLDRQILRKASLEEIVTLVRRAGAGDRAAPATAA